MNEGTTGNLLCGAIDTHIHTGPDLFARSVNDIEAAMMAKEAGMAAIMIKSHHTLTADRAALASSITGFPVFGGLTLNYFVGGFNRRAVETAIRFGAKQIWMPTITAQFYLQGPRPVAMFEPQLPRDAKGLSIWDENGDVLPAVLSILELVAKHRLILGSGHLSISETKQLVRIAREIGVQNILITHPQARFLSMSIEDMKELASMGALLEHHYVITTSIEKDPVPSQEIARAIREIGAEHCIMATDGGQKQNPIPTESLRAFMGDMLNGGISEKEIRVMTHDNPKLVLGLE